MINQRTTYLNVFSKTNRILSFTQHKRFDFSTTTSFNQVFCFCKNLLPPWLLAVGDEQQVAAVDGGDGRRHVDGNGLLSHGAADDLVEGIAERGIAEDADRKLTRIDRLLGPLGKTGKVVEEHRLHIEFGRRALGPQTVGQQQKAEAEAASSDHRLQLAETKNSRCTRVGTAPTVFEIASRCDACSRLRPEIATSSP